MLTLNTWWLGQWPGEALVKGGRCFLFILLIKILFICKLQKEIHFSCPMLYFGVLAHVVAQARLEFIPGSVPPHLVYVVGFIYLFIFLDSGQQKCASCITTS